MVVYHQTFRSFDSFHPGSHFGTIDAANERGRYLRTIGHQSGLNTVPVYLRIENPYWIEEDGLDDPGRLWEICEDRYPDLWPFIAVGDDLISAIRQAGYDGMRYRNEIEGGISWVIVDPRQAKSALGFDGRFDRLSPSLTGVRDWQVQEAEERAAMRAVAARAQVLNAASAALTVVRSASC